jgi:glycosyltransferase involved in cell wall biosynthesis
VTVTELPEQDVDHAPLPELVSIVVPCLNEELTIGEFVDWCFEGLRGVGVEGEVIIVDSSTDHSPEIAEEHGARVLRVPKRGLGRAYIDAIPEIRGTYVIMGDCDLTYDFRELAPFVERLRAGAEFVMGNRFGGYIEPAAMPRLHRYFGTPVTTWILNLMYGTSFGDIHCGMRAMRTDALKRIGLQSEGWEYASEMILKAVKLRLRLDQVPVRFYRDREGRMSHHKRSGWSSPWIAGWNNLRVMFLYAPDFFLLVPSTVIFVGGFLLSLALARGAIDVGSFAFDVNWMLLAMTMTTLGYSGVQLGVLSRVYYDFDHAYTLRVLKIMSYNRGVLASLAFVAIGLVPNVALLVRWISGGLRLSTLSHPAIFGLLLIVVGWQTFGFTLLLHIIGGRLGTRAARAS